jgi:hypothetical protein
MLSIGISQALNNGLGKIPQMGKLFMSCVPISIIYSFKDGTVGIIFVRTLAKT